MWKIILFLVAGIAIGNRLNLNDSGKAVNGRLQQIGLLLLLLAMGISIGLNESVLADISSIGWQSIAFAFSTTFGSILAVWLVSRFIYKGV